MKLKKGLLLGSSLLFVASLTGCKKDEPIVYTVAFDCSAINESIPEQKVKRNERVVKPEIEITAKEDTQKFDGYRVNNEIYDFNTPVTSDFVITCSVVDNYHTIEFDPGEEGTIDEKFKEPIPVLHGKKISEMPIVKTGLGVGFLEWRDEDDNKFDETKPITKNYKLHAVYEDEWINITTDSNRNIDSETPETELICYIEGHGDVTNTCDLSIIEGDDLIQIEDKKIKPMPVSGDDAKSGVAIIKAEQTIDGTDYYGYYTVSVGNLKKFDPELLKDGYVAAKDKEIDGRVLIPSVYFMGNGYIMLSDIKENGFANCNAIEYVYIPSYCSTIGNAAFANCTALKTLNFAEGINKIDDFAFVGCDALEEITIPKSVETLGAYAFYACDKLTNVTFSDPYCWFFADTEVPVSYEILKSQPIKAITNLYCDAPIHKKPNTAPGLNCYDIQLDLNSSYTTKLPIFSNQEVNYYTKDYNIAVIENGVIIPKKAGTTSIMAKNLDTSKYSVINVTVRDKKYLEQTDGYVYAPDFYGLYDFTLPETIDSTPIKGIIEAGFFNINAIDIVYISDNIEEICLNAFASNRVNHVRFGLNSKLKYIWPMSFYNCDRLNYINIPDSVETISLAAFQCCSALSYIHLPKNDKYTVISKRTFMESNLRAIVIPSNVTTINDEAFNKCSNLKDIYYEGDKSIFASLLTGSKDIFTGCPAKVVHCLDGDYTI